MFITLANSTQSSATIVIFSVILGLLVHIRSFSYTARRITSEGDGDAANADAVLRLDISRVRQCDGKLTYDDTVGAGDASAAALGAGADPNDADRAAGEPEENVQVAEVDADGLEDGGASRRVGLEKKNDISARGNESNCMREVHTGSVLEQQAVVADPPVSPRATLAGVAAARRATESAEKRARRLNMFALLA